MIKIFFRKLQLNYLINSLQKEMSYSFDLYPNHLVQHELDHYNSVLIDLRNKRFMLK